MDEENFEKHEIPIVIVGSVLLFILTFGMSATVSFDAIVVQMRNRKSIVLAIFSQYVIMPFLGFVAIKTTQLNETMGFMLLIICCSPSGSYSNWWSSVFNAELALSIGISTISAIISMALLPLNVMMYSKLCYGTDAVRGLNFDVLYGSLSVYLSGLVLGLVASSTIKWEHFNVVANTIGNLAGFCLLVLSFVMANTQSEADVMGMPWYLYVGVAAPFVLGMIIVNAIATYSNMPTPQRMTVACESCCQNLAITISVAMSMFNGQDLSFALGVPLYYGIVEATGNAIYGFGSWKAGWSKAPVGVSIFKFLGKSYEMETKMEGCPDAKSADLPDAMPDESPDSVALCD